MAPKRKLSLNVRGKETPKRAKSNSKQVDIPSEDLDNRKIVRIGLMTNGTDDSNPEALPLQLITVAMVERDDQSKITFCNIDTWHINGLHIGDYSSADNFTKRINQISMFQPDSYFTTAYHDGRIEDRVLESLSRDAPRLIDESSTGTTQDGRKKTPKISRFAPIKAPLRPEHDFTPFEPVELEVNGEIEEIDAVISFFNDLTDHSMKLPRNHQASLDPDETYTEFLKYIHDIEIDKKSYTTLAESFEKPNFKYWADIEVWVLPQGATKMSEWTATSGHVAQDFLNPETSEEYGHQLYIQIRIKGHPDHERKNEEWLAEAAEKSSKNAGVQDRPPSRKTSQKSIHQGRSSSSRQKGGAGKTKSADVEQMEEDDTTSVKKGIATKKASARSQFSKTKASGSKKVNTETDSDTSPNVSDLPLSSRLRSSSVVSTPPLSRGGGRATYLHRVGRSRYSVARQAK